MKVIDIVLPDARTNLEHWQRWQNRLRSQWLSRPGIGKKINVIHLSDIDCTGDGRRYCVEQGEHSWFNHSMDSFYTSTECNIPIEYERDPRYDR